MDSIPMVMHGEGGSHAIDEVGRLQMAMLRDDIRSQAYASMDQQTQQRQLLEELARQKLVITALTRLVVSKGLVSEAELAALIRRVDEEDGMVDGKIHLDIPVGRPKPFKTTAFDDVV